MPNEVDLKVTALNAVYTDLKAKNLAVTTAEQPLINARISRNDTLYKPITGMVDISVDVKTYIKSVYGATSPQYKAISSLKFINYNYNYKISYLFYVITFGKVVTSNLKVKTRSGKVVNTSGKVVIDTK